MRADVKEGSEGLKEVEVRCACGRKIKIKFLAPVIMEQEFDYEIRGENSIP